MVFVFTCVKSDPQLNSCRPHLAKLWQSQEILAYDVITKLQNRYLQLPLWLQWRNCLLFQKHKIKKNHPSVAILFKFYFRKAHGVVRHPPPPPQLNLFVIQIQIQIQIILSMERIQSLWQVSIEWGEGRRVRNTISELEWEKSINTDWHLSWELHGGAFERGC